jgi:hypothetical protein
MSCRCLKELILTELAEDWLRERTKKLMIAERFLERKDPTLFFREPDEENMDS